MQPALGRLDVGEVGDPLLGRCVVLERSVKHVVGNDTALPRVLWQGPPAWFGTQRRHLQRSLDAMQPAVRSQFGDITTDPVRALGAVASDEGMADLRTEQIASRLR